MNVKGKIVELFDTVQVKETFKKREFVLEHAENPQYPEFVKFELIQDKCELLDNNKVGDEVEVHFNLKGRKWVDPKGETKYFNSLHAWKIDKSSEQQAEKAQAGQFDNLTPPPVSESDDLPF